MNNIAIFASGNGTNAENIINYFNNGKPFSDTKVMVVMCNKRDAYVFERAKRLNVPGYHFTKADLEDSTSIVAKLLGQFKIDYIILAGFLLKVPEWILDKFPARVINIHPALLPMYGGKGMYGHHVHEAVIAAKEKKSGITVHLADEKYDNGSQILQATCSVSDTDTPDTLADKIHYLEQLHFPNAIDGYIYNRER